MATGDDVKLESMEKGDQETPFNDSEENVRMLPAGVENVEKVAPADEFYGLSREELETYAKDPKWVKVRWILFGIFVAGWIAMLVAAIVIVVLAKKCPPTPDLKWYQTGVMYKIDARKFQDSDGNGVGDLNGVQSRLAHLEDLAVYSVWLEKVVTETSANLSQPDEPLGSALDFKNLASTFKKRGIRVVIDLEMTGIAKSSAWFQRSEKQEPGYKDLFLHSSSGVNSSAGDSASAPALFNAGSPDIKSRLEDLVRDWAALGAEGFVVRLPQGTSEEHYRELFASSQLILDELNHLDDRDRVMITPAGLNMTALADVDLAVYTPNATDCNNQTVDCQNKLMADIATSGADKPWKIMLIHGGGPAACQLARKLTAPGTPNINYGDEIGLPAGEYMKWTDDLQYGFTNKSSFVAGSTQVESVLAQKSSGFPGVSQFKLFKELSGLRRSHPSLKWGAMRPLDFAGVQAFVREAEGFPKVVVALNLGNQSRSGSLAVDEFIQGEVLAVSGPELKVGDLFDVTSVYLPKGAVLVVKLLEPEEKE